MNDGKIQYIIELLQTGDTKATQDQLKGIQTEAGKTKSALDDLGKSAENSLASGMSHAFVEIINGTKSAGDAFKEFATSILQQITQMILQMLILRAVQSAFGFSGGGSVFAGGGGATGDAAGGVHFAASGLAGVGEVSAPTLFPKFNVLAGEAGSELLTVLAHPQTMSVGGEAVAIGNAGAARLAILSQASLGRMVRAASGFQSAIANPQSAISSGFTALSAPQSDGRILVELRPHPAYSATVMENTVAQARVAVANDFLQDTPIRSAAKQALT